MFYSGAPSRTASEERSVYAAAKALHQHQRVYSLLAG